MTRVKRSAGLTLHDRLSRLSFEQAAKLLGTQGKRLIMAGAGRSVEWNDVYLGGDLLRVTFRELDRVEAIATLTLATQARDRLLWNCDHCEGACEHVGAMFSLVLENKTPLGLAEPPPEATSIEGFDDDQLAARALAERQVRAREERMKIAPTDADTPWTDYLVTSLLSGKSYRAAVRGLQPGQWYCSCPDFRTNTLGVCKHLLKVESSIRRKFTPRLLARPYRPERIEVHLQYERETTLRLLAPAKLAAPIDALIRPFVDKPIDDLPRLLSN